ncbi:DmpA family aminopeptidase [Bacillaceae bacterium W0354]
MQKRIRDYGIAVGNLKTGPLNKITDVNGVTVGHSTIDCGDIKTGVTAILPHQGNIFKEKVISSSHVINGFGKTIGTVQIEELGTIETPILLTNTLSVGIVADSLVKYMLEQNEEIGNTTGTVNPVVGECNDMYLNDIRKMVIDEHHVRDALENTVTDFEEGACGAGTGMKCFDLKGGIGSASRLVEVEHGTYTVGVLVLSNFGKIDQLRLNGKTIGNDLKEKIMCDTQNEKGSIMIVLATDLPVSERQLKRISKRVSVGLSRTGSFFGNGSGDLVVSFSTANKIPHEGKGQLHTINTIDDNDIDLAFEAVADATEEAIYNSMVTAKTTIGRQSRRLYSLSEFL